VTKQAIAAYAEVLAAEGLDSSGQRLKEFGNIFYGYLTKQLDILLTDVAKLDLSEVLKVESTGDPEGGSIGQVIGNLRNLQNFLKTTSNGRRSDDVAKLQKVLKRYESVTVAQLILALRFSRRRPRNPTVPMTYYSQLARKIKAALGRNDQFGPLYEELATLDAAGVAKVANTLMSSGSSNSRKRDLTRIRERHQSMESNFAKERVTAGRSAA